MDNFAKIFIADSRSMAELKDASIDLAVTSPPYWQIKDYHAPGQIGHGQSLHDYLRDLYRVWRECFRVLRPGSRLCLNIGDQFARAAVYGRYKVIPLHAEFVAQCEQLGFDFLGAIIWQKKTTMNTTGGAVVMGSYPYPTNGIVELDYEFIQIFKKPGAAKKVAKEVKEASRLTKMEWKEYFSGHWYFGGVRQVGHEAMFPDELPRRLIKMFTFKGDTVLDPFLGSGTTARVALEQGRNAVGYEINEGFWEVMSHKLHLPEGAARADNQVRVLQRRVETLSPCGVVDYSPRIKDAGAPLATKYRRPDPEPLLKVVGILDEGALALESGLAVNFLGVRIEKKAATLRYLHEFLLGKAVRVKFPHGSGGHPAPAYIYLKNKIFINAFLIKSGLGAPDPAITHKFRVKFAQLQEKRT
jgi:modification methylase